MDADVPSKIAHNGYDYTFKDSNKLYHRHRCSHYRSKNCTGLLKVNGTGGGFIQTGLKHYCQLDVSIRRAAVDARKEYFEAATELAMANLGKSASRIWDAVDKKLIDKYTDISVHIMKPPRDEIINSITN
jgi:hypothetical protein